MTLDLAIASSSRNNYDILLPFSVLSSTDIGHRLETFREHASFKKYSEASNILQRALRKKRLTKCSQYIKTLCSASERMFGGNSSASRLAEICFG